MTDITSVPLESFGLLYSYKSIIVFVTCMIIFVIKKYFDIKKQIKAYVDYYDRRNVKVLIINV